MLCTAMLCVKFKREVSREFDVIPKPKNVCVSTEKKSFVL